MAEYRIKDTLYRLATPKDDTTLKRLLHENPMKSWVNISTEREPSYFDGASLMGETYALIAHDAIVEENIIGMYSCSYLPVHIDGNPEMIGYFGGLRVVSEFRHKIHYIKHGFEALKKIVPLRGSVPFYFTSIASENTIARRLLEANMSGMPCYSPVGEMTTMIFSVNQGKNGGILVQARSEDISDIVSYYNKRASSYQLSPYLSEEWLQNTAGHLGLDISDFWLLRDKNGVLRCCFSLWDQRAFKQSVVKGYKAPLKHLRILYNWYARMTRRVELPLSGKALDHLYIAFFACDADDTDLAVNVLKEAAYIARAKRATSCVMGMSSHHVLLPILKHTLKSEIYRTQIEVVTLNGDDQYTNISERIIQPEVALL
ncbi:MAG: hypothetical protein PHW18_12380 [Sulfuricurvum sp.]|uniref:hypothetical protein n=1 Tax=Sulfuricurvum sp. TaxID=2025608 RepID=UPI00261CF97B|nr:hypothetical protein [Sulfuricurvum sp.]MDD2830363.1 hypothetical protein [Sulfuricurvum sp.]MDD4950662.1 hypothetical protein [Sulfuricurvum sp.]